METLNTGGVSALASDLTASPRHKPDISGELQRAKQSLVAWKKLLAEGKVESLVVKLASPSDPGTPARMLTPQELEQLRASKKTLGDYVERILKTPPIKNE